MYQKQTTGWWLQVFCMFIPGEMFQFDLRIFSDGVVQPPTSNLMKQNDLSQM